MHRGKIVERGPSDQVLDHPQDPYTQLLRASVPGPGWKPVRRTRAATAASSEHMTMKRPETWRATDAEDPMSPSARTCPRISRHRIVKIKSNSL